MQYNNMSFVEMIRVPLSNLICEIRVLGLNLKNASKGMLVYKKNGFLKASLKYEKYVPGPIANISEKEKKGQSSNLYIFPARKQS